MLQEILPILPLVNALLISTSGVFILMGVAAVRRGDRALHQKRMLVATGLAGTFLIIYLTRLYLGGLTVFPGPHWVKMLYLFILFSHIGLALVQTPLVFALLWHAYRKNHRSHRKLGRITYPLWVYVSFTGVLVYGLLHFPYA